jgi:hypothetical protein
VPSPGSCRLLERSRRGPFFVVAGFGELVGAVVFGADVDEVAGAPALGPDGVEEVLVGAAQVELFGVVEQPERDEGFLETGEDPGALLECRVDVVGVVASEAPSASAAQRCFWRFQ